MFLPASAASEAASATTTAIAMNTFDWNNRAVQQLRRGNSSDAVLILLKTVFRLRQARARVGLTRTTSNSSNSSSEKTTTQAHQDQDQDDQDKFVANVPISTWPKTDLVQGDHRSRIHHHQNSDNDIRRGRRRRPVENIFTLFDHAFVTSSSTTTANTKPQEDAAAGAAAQYRPLTYAIVLYNTGLSLHLKGMEDDQIKQTQTQSLHLAAKFYTMALQVLEDSYCQDGSSSELLLLLLALFNNLGHIHCHLFNVPEAQRCVEWLRSLVTAKSLLLLPDMRDEHSFFCMSILIPPGSEFALAPAA